MLRQGGEPIPVEARQPGGRGSADEVSALQAIDIRHQLHDFGP
jgi:hypothetical protein